MTLAESISGNEHTNATTPFLIWKDNVMCLALKRGASQEHISAASAKLPLWYRSGEPCYMAADGVLQLTRGAVVASRDDADRRVLSAAFKAAAVVRP